MQNLLVYKELGQPYNSWLASRQCECKKIQKEEFAKSPHRMHHVVVIFEERAMLREARL